MKPLSVTVWNENRHEQRTGETPARIYPLGMHKVIADGLIENLGDLINVRTATLDDSEHGLSQSVIDATDVLLWWGHEFHSDVSDEVVERVFQAVLGGMGLIVLHSGHYSKIFRRLMGTTCSLRWRNNADRELIWTIAPTHPIALGVSDPIVISEQEMYGEFFDIPTPDELIFISSFSGGEVFRSGATWSRGLGKVFYFSPGDQEYPIYYHPEIRKVLANGVIWSKPSRRDKPIDATFKDTDWFLK
jgi:trehalose utilization protein